MAHVRRTIIQVAFDDDRFNAHQARKYLQQEFEVHPISRVQRVNGFLVYDIKDLRYYRRIQTGEEERGVFVTTGER